MRKLHHREHKPWDEDGYSSSSLWLIQPNGCTEADVEEEFNWRCWCEHDCCGHVSNRVSRIFKCASGNWAVLISHTRNI